MSASQSAQTGRRVGVGDHCPMFSCTDSDGNLFEFFVAVTGKPVVLIFCGGAEIKELPNAGLPDTVFDQDQVQAVTVVCGQEEDARAQKAVADWPLQTLADPGGEITAGFDNLTGVKAPAVHVLDPNQRVVGMTSLEEAGGDIARWLEHRIDEASHPEPSEAVSSVPPVLMVPRVLEPEDCAWLIGLWRDGEKQAGQVSLGSEAGDSKGVVEDLKRREDYVVKNPEVEQRILGRLMPRLVPEIRKVLHFQQWSMEALRIGCYKAEDAGFFHVHRDNCNPSVADRKFAITVNLNTGEYEGGDLRFPEYGNELFQPPAGGAIVFSCSMLHEVLPVTSGERYTLLTFLTQPS